MKKDLKKISNSKLYKFGKLKSFKEQINDFENKLLPSGVELIVSNNSNFLKYAKVNNNPIIIFQGKINKIKLKHSTINKIIILNLDNYLKNSVLAMDSLTNNNAKVIVLNKNNVLGNPIIVIIHLNKSNAKIKINEITSIYDKKEFQNFINKTGENGKNIYTNEKTEKWLLRNGLQLPTRFTNNSVLEKRIPQ